jgi:hypothetical protein
MMVVLTATTTAAAAEHLVEEAELCGYGVGEGEEDEEEAVERRHGDLRFLGVSFFFNILFGGLEVSHAQENVVHEDNT